MAFKEFFYSLGLTASFALATVYSVDLMPSGQEKKINQIELTLGTLNAVGKNISNFQREEVKSIEANTESSLEDQVISAINKDLDKEIKKSKLGFVKKYHNIKKNKLENKAIVKIVEDQIEVKSSAIKKDVQTDLSIYEINNKELVEQFEFKFEKISIIKFEVPEINEATLDKVETKVSSVQKAGPIEPEATNEVAKNIIEDEKDDLTVFEYSPKMDTQKIEKKFDKKLYERPLSANVLRAIKREVGHVKKLEYRKEERDNTELSQNEVEDLLSKKTVESNVVDFDYSAKNTEVKKEVSQFTSTYKPVEVGIKILGVNLNTQQRMKATGFEFTPDYDRNERSYDQNSGEIKVGYSSSENLGVQTGVLEARGFISTRIELVMDTQKNLIPVFEESSYEAFLNTHKVNNQTSIIISLANGIKDVEIDSMYSQKIALDKNFKVSDGNRQYIMFLGVKTGNVLLRFQTENGEAEKISFVGEGEVFFDEPRFSVGEREVLELTTRNLMSHKQQGLNLSPEAVKIFNSNYSSRKSALNAYELKMPTKVFGDRNYVEIKNKDNSVIVGVSSDYKVEVPATDFVKKVIEFNQVTNLEDRCLVQINVKKEVSELKIGGKNANGDMFLENSFLDFEGNLSKEYEGAEKIFVMGENEGIINLNINYADGSTESLKSYCSNGTYLIEQL